MRPWQSSLRVLCLFFLLPSSLQLLSPTWNCQLEWEKPAWCFEALKCGAEPANSGETHFVRGVWRGRTNLERRKAIKQHQLANVLRGPSRPEAEKMRNQLFQNTTGLQYTAVASWQKSHSPSLEQTLGWLYRLLLGNMYLHMMISSISIICRDF